MCGCECFISDKIMHPSLLSWSERYLKKLKDQGCNAQNRRFGEITNCLFESCKNSSILHGKYIVKTASDMAMATMCVNPSSKYALPHWKCVLGCCAQCTHIDLPSPESDQHNSHVSPTIHFHVYQKIARCIVHGRCPFNDKKQCQLYEASSDSIVTTRLYTRR